MIQDIDMEKVKSSLAKIRELEAAKARTLFMRNSIARELIGYDLVKSEYRPRGIEHASKLPPVDEVRRTHTSKVRSGCSGFNHPHFHQ